jgi:hypothetical protein
VEFAVANISDIKWSTSSFDHLRIAEEEKTIIRALSILYLNRGSGYTFDDVVEGKGRGLVLLLQYVAKSRTLIGLLTKLVGHLVLVKP